LRRFDAVEQSPDGESSERAGYDVTDGNELTLCETDSATYEFYLYVVAGDSLTVTTPGQPGWPVLKDTFTPQ
jgi:hypothetical protein